ncbi:MAG TPA: hypothetical protein VF549_09485 [Solirubrobacteraceae bacterium]|jgi:hypothetical protein
MTHFTTPTISIRAATHGDGPALARLAALDSAPVPFGPVLLAEVDGQPRAALSVREDVVIGDPFARTEDLADLLRVHARATAPREDRRQARGFGRLRLAA